ncbi:double-strand break repair protein AddB [Devosia rhizoryzae]|uniref:Double-strand break repair protein AddB n=1 Tax=Devosia rhizoryzae TaxID=2774137 RepID=A0ABX7C887_9HYPH|nr:double-strand break repair protein AddB [Devosia rhizoryzae]QQR38922.1 double-strand break repair protein AddB [Devosia rhizoryzae]
MSLFSIAPSTPFLLCLTDAIMDGRLLGGWERSGPFWLSDVSIIVPTQRARQGLAEAFARHPDFTGLLPDIRTFGGDEADEEPFLPPFDAPALPKTATGLQRRLVLSKLVAQWAQSERGRLAFSTPPTAAEIFSMAESLGQLIDDLTIEEKTPADIRALGEDMAQDLGEYWQQTLEFLDIALAAWPALLTQDDRADTATLRRIRLDRQAAAAQYLYRDRPVIAAGSTGSIPATARLLAAIAKLPRGAVVLPGLDMAMTPATHEALLDPESNPHGHPQYGLAHLLRQFGAGVGQVTELCKETDSRTSIVNHALALTRETARWAGQRPAPSGIETAFAGVTIIRARNEDEEGRSVAVAARAALERGQSVGIVTPDRNLARRIAAELKRFGIHADDAAGAPLFQSPAGALARQILNLVAGSCNAVDLLALLRNEAALLGRERGEVVRLANLVDLGLLRGQRPAPGIAGLRQMLAAHLRDEIKHPARRLTAAEGVAISGLLDDLHAAILSLESVLGSDQIDAGLLANALWSSFEALSLGATLHGRREMADWAGQMAGLAGEGHRFAPFGLDGVLSALMTGFEVRNREERRRDIYIWGQIEARLMSPDLMILGGLNEDKWPGAADPGPWLSRGMRIAAGLEPPERMQGLAAHDFAQALGNGKVIVTYADRVGSSPALPSRLVQRLDAFVGADATRAMEARGAVWIETARRVDTVEATAKIHPPTPNPPAAIRPRKLSVTEVETLMRSPYDLYAKHVLRLRPLDVLGDDPDARERGTIVHAIFGRFVQEGHDPVAEDAFERLMLIAAEEFGGLDTIGERRDIWLRRFAAAAHQFLDFERARAANVLKRHAEISGRWGLKLAEPFRITGTADRVDVLADGSLEILDFKTGSPPAPASMRGFEAPQLPLEALMAGAGAMEGLKAAPTSALTYIKIGLGPEAFKPSSFALPEDMDVMALADEVGRRMQGHIDLFLMRDTPMPARLMPLKTQRFSGAYDHLARVAEWTLVDGEEEP